jgi:hypothetical protein
MNIDIYINTLSQRIFKISTFYNREDENLNFEVFYEF